MLDFHIRDRIRSGFDSLTSPSRDSGAAVPPVTPSPLVSTSDAGSTAKLPPDLSSQLATFFGQTTSESPTTAGSSGSSTPVTSTNIFGIDLRAGIQAFQRVVQQELERQRQEEANNQQRLTAMQDQEAVIKQREEELARRQDEEAKRQQEALRQERLRLEEERRQEMIRQEQQRIENQRRLESIYRYQTQYTAQWHGQRFESQQNRSARPGSPFQAAFAKEPPPWETAAVQQGYWGFVQHNKAVSSVRPVQGSPGLFEVTYTDRGTRLPSTEILSSAEIATRFPGHDRLPHLEAKAHDSVTLFGAANPAGKNPDQRQDSLLPSQPLRTQLVG